MNFKIGDIVTRKSYNNDIAFKIISIDGNNANLLGLNVRLKADACIDDLVLTKSVTDDYEIIQRNLVHTNLDRENYFYIPGKILHIDGDNEYLERCMKYYESMGIKANGISINEEKIPDKVLELVKEYRPDIVVITGHDAYYSKKDDYQNSNNFILAIKNLRKYERSQEKLIIIAGACQSNYEELIKAGANFASSPKRINIHALDPAILASSIAFSSKNKSIDLIELIDRTKYGSDGMGGIITNGTMYVGYPR